MENTGKLSAANFIKRISDYASFEDAVFLQRFFKTGKGEYGEGDRFIGVRVPNTRKVCKEFFEMPLSEIEKLIKSPVHEHRLGAVILLSEKYKKSDNQKKKEIFEIYMKALEEGFVNNWDIVDVSCSQIVGEWLSNNRQKLYQLASSGHLWQRRVSIISTFSYIRKGESETTLDIAEILLNDKHDLIQKAVGWMLREVGKKIDETILVDFLEKHSKVMPRTMLRYACEKLTEKQRKYFYQK